MASTNWVETSFGMVPEEQTPWSPLEAPGELVVAFTGHRPDKLPLQVRPIYEWLQEMLRAIHPKQVISGMALGVDTLGAIAALKMGLPLVAAVPFEGQDAVWQREEDKVTYRKILDRATEVVYISPPGYEPWKMHARNHWMVDRSNILLAVWDGNPKGGTYACLKYALQGSKRPTIIRYRSGAKVPPVNG